MASSMDKLAKELKKQMTDSDERKPKPYDTQAEVLRVENGVAWVHIPGGVDETPVRLTINAKKGDNVNLHVANGTAWITGNSTNPPTDDSTANYAVNISNEVKKDVIVLNTVVAENIEATNARFTNVEADTAKIHNLTADDLHATVGYIEDLTTDSITANDISAASGYIKDLEADNITAQDISASSGYIKDLEADNITAQDISASSGYIKDLTAGNVAAQDVIADHATVGNLDTTYAKINAANINTATIRNAWVDKIMVQTGLLAYSSQIYTLDAIEVNAANITAGTLDVNRLIVTVGEGSSAQKYLVNIDPSTGTPSYEKLDGNIVEPRTITANKIVANSITTDEITVNNLVGTSGWINLHEGKFFYGNGADFATSANAISWNGSKLQIKADEFLLSTGKTIQDSIESVENWFYSVPPTTSNEPAKNWTTNNLKEQHLRDIYFDTTSGKSYRWAKEGSTYKWVEIEDVELAALAKDLHDNYPPRSEFTIAPNQINAEVSKKVGNNEVIAKINASVEEEGGSAVKIHADKVNIEGAAIFTGSGRLSTTSLNNSYDAKGAAQSAVDGIEVGGRNILVGTGTSISKATTATSSYVTQILYDTPNLAMLSALGFAVNDEVTLSFDWKITSASTYGNARIEWYGKTSSAENSYIAPLINPFATFSASNTSGHVTKTVKLTSATVQAKRLVLRIDNSNLTLTISNLKLEKGNKATDWSPAPEDVQAEIDAKKSVHTLDTAYSYTYAQILTYSAEGYSGGWTTSSNAGVKAGDTVRLKVTVSDMSNAPVYVVGTVTEVLSNGTGIRMTSHGLDTTIIDGGNILTNSIGANQIQANSIGTKQLTVSDSTNLATANEMYESSIPSFSDSTWQVAISGGYLIKKTATQIYIMLTDYTSNNFKQHDELYYEFYAKAATAGPVYLCVFGYSGTPPTHTYVLNHSKAIALTTSEAFYSGTIELTSASWNQTITQYIIGFSDSRTTKSQIYVRKVVVRRKSAGELIVDGSITADHLDTNAIVVGKMNQDTKDKVLNSNIKVGGENLLQQFLIQNDPTIYQAYKIPLSENLIVGETYTLQLWGVTFNNTPAGGTVAAYWGGGSIGLTGDMTPDSNGYVSKTFTVTQAMYNIRPNDAELWHICLYNSVPSSAKTSRNMKLNRWKLEKGNKATAWSLSSADTKGGVNLLRCTADMNVGSGGWTAGMFRASGGTATHVTPPNPHPAGINGAIRVTNTGTSAARIGFAQDGLADLLTTNKLYTLSGWLRASAGALSIDFQPIWAAAGQTTGSLNVGKTSGAWGYYSATLRLTGDQKSSYSAGYIYVNDVPANGWFEVCGLKLEEGGIATGWTPGEEADASNYISMNSSGIRIASANPSTQNQRIELTSGQVSFFDSDNHNRMYMTKSNVVAGLVSGAHSVFNDTGVYIYDGNNKKRTEVDSGGLKVFDTNGSTNVASFGSTARIGPEGKARAEVTSSGLAVYNASNKQRGSFGGDWCMLGDPSATRVTIGTATNNAYIYMNANGHAAFQADKDGVHLYDTAGKERTRVNADGLNVYNESGTSVAQYGDEARIGAEASRHIEISDSGFEVRKNKGVSLASIGYGTGAAESGSGPGPYYIFGSYLDAAEAPANYSISAGVYSEALGFCSRASGYYVKTNYANQTAIGKYNSNNSNNVFEIGWGTSSTPKNIFEVTNAGVVKANGVSISSTTRNSFTPTSGASYSGYGGCYYEKYGNVVHVHVGVSGLTANTATNISTLPDGCRPHSTVFAHGTGGTWDNLGYLQISKDGVVMVRSKGTYCGADVTYIV